MGGLKDMNETSKTEVACHSKVCTINRTVAAQRPVDAENRPTFCSLRRQWVLSEIFQKGL